MARAILHLELPGIHAAAAVELGLARAGEAVIVQRDQRVLDLAGVPWLTRGQPLRQAQRLAPEATIVPVGALSGAETYRAVWDTILPLGVAAEPTAWHAGYVDVSGCLPRRGVKLHLAALSKQIEAHTGQPPARGVAQNKLIARHASPLGRLLAPDEALGFLHGRALRPDSTLRREMIGTLDELGCHRWGDVAQVPEPRLHALFGLRGTLLHRWSQGLDPRPVRPLYPPPSETARALLEPEEAAAWLERVEQLVQTLSGRLRRRGEQATEVVLVLGLRQGRDGLRSGSFQTFKRKLARGIDQAARLREVVLGLLPMDLDPLDLDEVRVTLRGLRLRGALQAVLFVDEAEERRHLLDGALARIRAKWGLNGLGWVPEIVASRQRLAESIWQLEDDDAAAWA